MAAKTKSKKVSNRRSVKLDAQLHAKLKQFAAENGRLLEYVIDRAVEHYIAGPLPAEPQV